MPIYGYELFNSRSFNVGKDQISASMEFVLTGSTNESDIRDALLLLAPATFPGTVGLVRETINARPLGGLLWHATVPYVPDANPLYPPVNSGGPIFPAQIPVAPGLNTILGADFAFDLTAQTEHVTQSKQTRQSIKRGGGVPPNTKRAIGVTADGEVQGCDRFKPYLEWSTSKTFEFVTLGYIYKLSELVGTTNNVPFYGSETGTQMFLGATGNTKDINKCVITFKFARQKHSDNITIVEDLVVPFKRGWDYLWVAYKNVEDGNKLTQQPDAAYVEQIYDEGDFSRMGINL